MSIVLKKETIHRKVKHCDICDKETSLFGSKSCCICNIDLCEEHAIKNPQNHGDYPDVYCKQCWKIGKQYREEIFKLEEKISQIEDEWINKAKSAKIQK